MTCNALRFILLAAILSSSVLAIPMDDVETVRTSNAAILNRLGLSPLLVPDGHHRKRLAPEAFGPRDAAGHHQQPSVRLHQSTYGRRHGGSAHDSHVYVVKLPPSPPYYSFAKPHKAADGHNVTVANPNPGFRNNGKPAKIYHWNLPLLKKISEKKKHMAVAKMEQARRKMEAERERQKVAEKMNYFKKLAQEQLVAETQRKPSRNNDKWLSHPEKVEPRTKNSDNAIQLKILSSSSSASNGDKIYRLSDNHHEHQPTQPQHQQTMSRNAAGHHNSFTNWHEAAAIAANDLHGSRNSLDGQQQQQQQQQRAKKHKKKSAVSYYYAPAITGKSASTSISKHFAGNGKPKAFYVMEKSRKPIYYHPLLP